MSNNRWISIPGKSNTVRTRTGASAVWRVVVCLGVAVIFVLSFLPSYARGDNRRVEPRRLVRTVEATYTIYQAGKEIGQETVTRSDFSDNSIEYRDKIELQLSQGANIVTKSDLLVDEESRFPMRYRMVKVVKQGATEYEYVADFEWFSNVAVVYTKSRADEDTLRLVLPTGTAVIDMNAVYHMYQPLYWHKGDIGGAQSFDVIDPGSKKLYSATLRKQASETVTVAGKDIEAFRYEFTRDKYKATIFVDGDGRIVKADQGFMGYELSDWSEETPKNQ